MTTFRMRAIADLWPGGPGADGTGFRSAVAVALAVERRAAKHAETRNDLQRYTRACELIEHVARSQLAQRLPDLVVDADDLVGAVDIASEPDDRSHATFHPPETLPALIAALSVGPFPAAELLSQFAAAAADQQAGLVLFDDDSGAEPSAVPARSEPARVTVPRGDAALAAAFAERENVGGACFAERPGRLAALARLREHIETALRAGEPIAVGSEARHDVLVEGLRDFAALSAGELRLVYVDGSEAEPFPSGLPSREPERSPQLRVGLMSLRHPERDGEVDAYWFRNRHVSTSSRTAAETDAHCTRATIEQLTALSARGVRCIDLVQSGFEAAVIGFYRGLITWLAAGNAMTVLPTYLGDQKIDVTGTAWS